MVRTSTKPRRTSDFHLTGAFELFYKSRDAVLDNFGVFVLLYFFPLIAGLNNGVIAISNQRHWSTDSATVSGVFARGSFPNYVWGFAGLALLVALILGITISIMTRAAELEAAKGHKVKLSALWGVTRKKWLQMVGLYILVGLATVIGLALFIIPGLIMIRRYFLAPYVLLDNDDISVWDAMEKSAAMSKGYSGSIWRIIGVMALITIIGAFPFIGWIASFGLGLLYTVAPAFRYLELKKLSSS